MSGLEVRAMREDGHIACEPCLARGVTVSARVVVESWRLAIGTPGVPLCPPCADLTAARMMRVAAAARRAS